MIEKVYKAYDIRGVYPDPLNEEIAWKTGHATAQFLRMNLQGLAKADPRMNMIIVGRDMRTSSPSLAKALIEGILATGTNVIDIGMIDTPQIYFAINHLGCCGGIQVTASHIPAQYNGFKISGLEARPIGENTGLNEIKLLATNMRKGPTPQTGRVETMDLSRPYKSHVLQFLKLNRPLKVVVDCSNGMAGKFVPNIFVGQPNLQIIPINLEITGQFKHEPNRFLTDKVATDHFYDRLQNLITRSVGFIAFRGGMGTVTEISLVWNKLTTGVLAARPLVLVGDCWPPVLQAWQRNLVVSDSDVRFLDLANDALTAADIIIEKSRNVTV